MRFKKKKVVLNSSGEYSKILNNRKLKKVSISGTATIRDTLLLVADPIVTERSILWTQGTKMWKIAADHYGDGRLYWVIGIYNDKPTDAHWEIGDVVYIPTPVEYVVDFLRK